MQGAAQHAHPVSGKFLVALLNNRTFCAGFVTVALQAPIAWLKCGSKHEDVGAADDGSVSKDRLPSANDGTAIGCAPPRADIVRLEAASTQTAWAIPVADASQRFFVAVVTQAVQVFCAIALLLVILRGSS